MASSSSSSPVPIFSGEGFAEWSVKMKDHLTSKSLWHLVKDGYKIPQSLETLTSKELGALQVNRINDAEAFLLIRKSIVLRISLRISNAKTAKEAWDILHDIFENNDASRALEELPSARSARRTSRVEKSQTKGKNIHSNASKSGSSTKPTRSTRMTDQVLQAKTMMIEPPRASNEGPSAQPPVRITQNMPNSDNPQFDVVLTKVAVRPSYILQFKAQIATMLPSNNTGAVVRCRGENYAIMFYGTRKRKGFGSGWKQLVDEHNLVKGDKLRFEVVKYSSYALELKIHILSCDAPLEMQEETRRSSDHDDDGEDIDIIDDQDNDNEYIDDVVDDVEDDVDSDDIFVINDENGDNENIDVVDDTEDDLDGDDIYVINDEKDYNKNNNVVDDVVSDDDDIDVVDDEDDDIEQVEVVDEDGDKENNIDIVDDENDDIEYIDVVDDDDEDE